MREAVVNIIVNVISTVLVWLLIAVVVVIVLGRRRRKLRGFFGLSDRQRIVVYLSSMPIDPASFEDRQGIRGSHRGIVLPNVEFRCVAPLMAVFSNRWSDGIADFLVTMAGIYNLRKPQIDFAASPLIEAEIRPVTTIAVGSIKFNTVTRYYLRTLWGSNIRLGQRPALCRECLGGYAAVRYSLVRPPRTCFRRIWCLARSICGGGVPRLSGWELVKGAVWPGGVVVLQVLGQDLAQVALVEDE
jgi:hypothetical protein